MKWLLLLVALVGCDEVISVKNLAPSVEALGYCEAGPHTYVVLRVTDHEADPVDVEVVVTLDGQRVRLGVGAAGDGDRGLSADEPGVLHLVEWGAACTGEACVDPCAAESVGLSGVSACAPRPATLPPSLTATLYASDRRRSSEVTADLALVPCP